MFFADRLKVRVARPGRPSRSIAAVFALGQRDDLVAGGPGRGAGTFLKTDDGANLLAGLSTRRRKSLKIEEKKEGPSIGRGPSGRLELAEEVALRRPIGRNRDVDGRLATRRISPVPWADIGAIAASGR